MNITRSPGDDGRESLTAVSNDRPCPVCGGDHKCAGGADGLLVCGRASGPVAGFRHLGPAAADPQFHLYRRADAAPPSGRPGPRPAKSRLDWRIVAEGFATTKENRTLAAALGLPEAVLAAMPLIGADAFDKCWTFPECDAAGTPVGVLRRFRDGSKKMLLGSRRGLSLAAGWRDRPGPVYLVEGPSDTLALTAAGLAAVGRPSNTGGVAYLAALLRDWPADRPVVVLGENDEKADGAWPGRDGARATAARLARCLGRPVAVALPPAGAKDARQWLTAQVDVDWPARGEAFARAVVPDAPPAPAAGPDAPPAVVITTREHDVNDAVAAALGREPDLFQRGEALVQVTDDPAPLARTIRRPTAPRIVAVSPAGLRERLSRCVSFVARVRAGENEVEKPAHPPGWCVKAVHERGTWPAVRRLEAVVDHPVLTPDGAVLTAPGYDPATGILYRPPGPLALAVPDRPTRADAAAAAARLLDVAADFPFAADAHRAAFLAAVLTPLARFAFPGPAPLFLFDGNTRGCGKTLLCDLIATIVTGQGFTVCSYTPDQDELRKRITALAMQGDRLVQFDNLDGPFGNGTLDRALTATSWEDRVLGENRTFRGPLYATWYATGNNVAVVADTVRRVCHVRLESPLERPDQRAGFRRPDLAAWAADNRPALLSAALTILRAYTAAGRPAVALPAWGSFTGWSDLVRAAVVWCGRPDPADTRGLLHGHSDSVGEAMGAFLEAVAGMDPHRRGLTAGDLIDAYKSPPAGAGPWAAALRGAIDALVARPDAKALGYRLRAYRKRVFGGRFVDRVGEGESGMRWAAFPAGEFHAVRPAPPAAGPSPGDAGDAGDAAGRSRARTLWADQMLPD